MKTGPMDNSDQIIKQYLLGQLSDSDQENLEHEYFVEAVALRKVEMGEDELIDEYLDKQLSPDERQSFLQIFLTTKDREEKLRLAKALREKVRKNAGGLGRMSRRLRIPSALLVRLGLGAIAASLILIAGLGWLLTHEIWQVRSLHSERRTWAEQESELQDRLAQADAENTRLDERVTQGLRARAGHPHPGKHQHPGTHSEASPSGSPAAPYDREVTPSQSSSRPTHSSSSSKWSWRWRPRIMGVSRLS